MGPILGRPCVSVTDMPAATKPGYTSPVFVTTSSSPDSTCMGCMPFHSARPLSTRRLTATESWPEASMTTFDSRATGSTQVMLRGSAETGIQFTTTPSTLPFLSTKSSNFVRLRNFTPESQALAISFDTACGPGVRYRPSETSL